MTLILNYKEIKQKYEKFKSNLPDGEFAKNYEELKYVRALINAIKKENIMEKIDKYKEIEKNNLEKLKKLGYKNIK